MWAMKAALKVGWQVRIHCGVIRSPAKIGVDGRRGMPADERVGLRRDRTVFEDDFVRSQPGHAAEPDDVGDRPELLELARADDGTVVRLGVIAGSMRVRNSRASRSR